MLPPMEQYNGTTWHAPSYVGSWSLAYTTGYEDGVGDDAIEHNQDSIPGSELDNMDPTVACEDIESVIRRQQAEVTELIAKFEEALK